MQILEDWGASPQSSICSCIFEYLLSVDPTQVSHISYGSFRHLVGKQFTDGDMLKAIQYLCGDRTPLLEAKFELIDSYGDFDLADSDFHKAQLSGELCHPETGEIITNFEDRVFMYFRPSQLIHQLRNSDVN